MIKDMHDYSCDYQNTELFNVTMTRKERDQLKAIAKAEGTNMSALLRLHARNYANAPEKLGELIGNLLKGTFDGHTN